MRLIIEILLMGAAVAIHKHWNKKPLPTDIIALKLFVSPVKNN